MSKERLIEFGLQLAVSLIIISVYVYFAYRSDKRHEKWLDSRLVPGVDRGE